MWPVVPCLSQILGGRRRVRFLLCLFVGWLVSSRVAPIFEEESERGVRGDGEGERGDGARRRSGGEGREIERPTSPLALSSLPVLRRQKNPETALSPSLSLCPFLPHSHPSNRFSRGRRQRRRRRRRMGTLL